MRLNLEGASIFNMLLGGANRFQVANVTLSGTYALAAGAGPVIIMDPGGSARNVTLPASPKLGDFFIIINSAGSALVLTIQDSAGAGLTPACTPTQNEIAIIIYCGATLGWRNMVGLGA